MKSWLIYGLLNAIVGLLVGIYLYNIATGSGYESFIYYAPVAIFLTGGVFWRFIFPGKTTVLKVVLVGILTGTVSHYITFILMAIGQNICYWTTGGCTDSMGMPPASINEMLYYSFLLTFFSLIFFGWITAPASILCGFVVKWLEKKNS